MNAEMDDSCMEVKSTTVCILNCGSSNVYMIRDLHERWALSIRINYKTTSPMVTYVHDVKLLYVP